MAKNVFGYITSRYKRWREQAGAMRIDVEDIVV
ncbi:hypothetical protein EV677_0875 [Herminiimonas fonticola]|uniref:Uncharacterized protein n=1 Tax=Herminiimonas fonticola TaxID=303380 RepID=A0A4R6GHC7_9BURK|nr:hypothetical protein Hfont_0849 [Herminiimonas fonticola]TDN94332.1 hypothetical protein EV677_0875 [Herminiimonas fonticola]